MADTKNSKKINPKLTKTDRLIAIDSILDWPMDTHEEMWAMIEAIASVVRHKRLKSDEEGISRE